MYKFLIVLLALLGVNKMAQACNCGGIPNVWIDAAGNNVTSNSKFQLGIFSDFKQFDLSKSTIAHNHVHEHSGATSNIVDERLKQTIFTTLSVKYLINKKYSILALVPYLIGRGQTDDVSAFADASFMGIRNIELKNELYLSFGLGLKLATGNTSNKFSSELLVPGTLSYDPLVTINAQKSFGKLIAKADGMFRYSTKNKNNVYYGNFATTAISVGYNFSTKNSCEIPDSTSSKQFILFGGLAHEQFGQMTDKNIVNASSGGNISYANLTAVFSFKNLTFSASYMQPMFQKWNGEQQQINNRCRASISINF